MDAWLLARQARHLAHRLEAASAAAGEGGGLAGLGSWVRAPSGALRQVLGGGRWHPGADTSTQGLAPGGQRAVEEGALALHCLEWARAEAYWTALADENGSER